MAELVITNRQGKWASKMPHQVSVNGRLAGVMRTPQARLRIPAGHYVVTIRTGGIVPIGKKGKMLDLSVSSTQPIQIAEGTCHYLDFKEKGQWWDMVFTIDLAVWIVSLLVAIPHPWNIVYHVLSDGFFFAWLVRLFIIRKRYYAMASYTTDTPSEEITPCKNRK